MIEIINLNKKIGKKLILKNINLSLTTGIIGVVGPNGSGKSSLFKTITGLYNKTSGEVNVIGSISSSIENAQLYNYLSGLNNLKIICDLYKVSYKNINKVIDIFDMKDFVNKKVKTYSMGMKQRLYLASAFVLDSDIIILDEPESALDPINIIKLKNIISSCKDKLIIYSTHSILNINDFCDKVIFLKEGEIVKECNNITNIEKIFKEIYNV